MKNRWKIWGIHFDLASKKLRVEELEKRLEEPGFWDDPEVSQQVMKELKGLQDSVKEIEKLYSDYEDMMLLIEMSEEEDSEETAEEIEEELQQFEEPDQSRTCNDKRLF